LNDTLVRRITVQFSTSRVHVKLAAGQSFAFSTQHTSHTSHRMSELAEIVAFSLITGAILLGAIVVAIKICQDDRARVLAARAQAAYERDGM
jgi:hypothetical protein